jgi:hypothetical protein
MVDDLRTLVSVNIEGCLFITQFAIMQMLAFSRRCDRWNRSAI